MNKIYLTCVAIAIPAVVAGVGYLTNGLVGKEITLICGWVALAAAGFGFCSYISGEWFSDAPESESPPVRNYSELLNEADEARKAERAAENIANGLPVDFVPVRPVSKNRYYEYGRAGGNGGIRDITDPSNPCLF